ncbi:MAG TPA: cytochrome c [Gemmatimonadaceae bacterium]|nr:cytochrome c [Gemmatimonadaceae bacterium]
MRKFSLGFVTALVLVPVAGFAFVRLGFMDPRADIPINPLERHIAMPSLDAAIGRRAPVVQGRLDASDSSLAAGMTVYQSNCAVCHGDVAHERAALADAMYPRAPQFVRDAPDMPEHENLYIIAHGVRLSGMPAWGRILSAQQLRQVTAFLAHMDSLPTPVAEQWRRRAGSSADTAPPTRSVALGSRANRPY